MPKQALECRAEQPTKTMLERNEMGAIDLYLVSCYLSCVLNIEGYTVIRRMEPNWGVIKVD